jgi:DNA polymerase elongation subunit (family B)
MLEHLRLDNILFIDIETVPSVYDFNELPDETAELFRQKERFRIENSGKEAGEHYSDRAGILAEFGRIICISAGYFTRGEQGREFRIKSFIEDDERELLENFFYMLGKYFPNHLICGHNVKEFDVPYICRRGVVQGLELPPMLQLYGKKPWEVNLLDTMELWKFGDFKHYTSLNLLAHILKVPSPKGDIDGSQVAGVYWEDGDIERIKLYCQKDVLTTARILQRMKGEEIVEDEHVVFAN